MLGEIAQRTTGLLRPRAWRGYGLVLLAAALPIGVLITATEHGWLPAIVIGAAGWCVLIAALTASAFAARWRSAGARVLAEHVARATPYALLHATIAATPLALTAALLVIANWVHPLLAFAFVPIAFVAGAVTAVAVLLAVAGAVMGDRSYVPSTAVELVRRGPWRLAGGLIAIGVPVLFAALPVACVGLVVMALVGPLGWFGVGLAVASPLPFAGALAVSAWRVLGGGVFHSAATAPARGAAPAEPTPTGEYRWQPGPEWRFVLDPTTPWGTWMELAPAADGSAAPRTVGLTVEVMGATMPRLLTCDDAGNWLEWPVPQTNGMILPVQLPVGSTYVQLMSTAQVPCHARLVISTQEWVETGASAAA